MGSFISLFLHHNISYSHTEPVSNQFSTGLAPPVSQWDRLAHCCCGINSPCIGWVAEGCIVCLLEGSVWARCWGCSDGRQAGKQTHQEYGPESHPNSSSLHH